jgi:release factor glutamine methyltransferase
MQARFNSSIKLSLSPGIIGKLRKTEKARMTVSISEAVKDASRFLRQAGVPEARREAGSLLAHSLGKNRTFLITHGDDLLDAQRIEVFREAVERRAKGEPLQYITGYQDFFGREFRVSPSVLIPRPETELLVEAALRLLNDSAVPAIVCDVGTGSGCIAITIASERDNVRVAAVDISPAALTVAKQNAVDHSVEDKVVFAISDCFASLPPGFESFDLIVSNPPYVSAGVVSGLQREVRDHEPALALSPGPDGLSIIRRLIQDAPALLQKSGHLILEIGFDQGEAVRSLINPEVWRLIDICPDLQGIPRIVVLQKIAKP